MTVVDTRVPVPARVERVGRITAQAREWRFVPTVLSLVAWLLVAVGRAAYAVFAGLWLACTWSAAAVKVGWDDARAAQVARRGDETSG